MSPDLKTIDPKMFGINLSEDTPLDDGSGGESQVFRDKEKRVVLKVYDLGSLTPTITLEQLRRYKEITAKVRRIAPSITTPKITWEVVPIQKIGVLPGQTIIPCSVSSFIDGPRLDENEIIERGLLDEVSRMLRERTGENSIQISRVNAKPKKQPDGGILMIITDVCARVSAIDS